MGTPGAATGEKLTLISGNPALIALVTLLPSLESTQAIACHSLSANFQQIQRPVVILFLNEREFRST